MNSKCISNYVSGQLPSLQRFRKLLYKRNKDNQCAKSLIKSGLDIVMSNWISYFIPKVIDVHLLVSSAHFLALDVVEIS